MSFHPSCDDEAVKLRAVDIPVGLVFSAGCSTVRDPEAFRARCLHDLANGAESVARAALYRSREVRRALDRLRPPPPQEPVPVDLFGGA